MYMFPQPVAITEDGDIRSTLFKGEQIDAVYNKFNKESFSHFINLITQGSILQAHLMTQRYQNILFVTTHKKPTLQGGVSDEYFISDASGFHMAPIVHKVTNSEGNIYVTAREGSESRAESLYKKFDVRQINSNSTYMLDTDKFYLQDAKGRVILNSSMSFKFDCVVLTDQLVLNKSNLQRSYTSDSIKADFASYCTPDFDLVVLTSKSGHNLVKGHENTNKRKAMIDAAAQIAPGPANGITWKLKKALSQFGFQRAEATRDFGGKRTRTEEVRISRYEQSYKDFTKTNMMKVY